MVSIKTKKLHAAMHDGWLHIIPNSSLTPSLFCFYCHHCCNHQWLERSVLRGPKAPASSNQSEALLMLFVVFNDVGETHV